MRKFTLLAAIVLAVLALDRVTNDARLTQALARNLNDYGRDSVHVANSALAFLDSRRN